MSIKVGITPDDLTQAVNDALNKYVSGVAVTMKDAISETAKETVRQLKRTSPRRTGDYAKGWKQKVLFENSREIRIKVYNGSHYRLTHLLEKGHRPGGRNHSAFVPGHPHIQQAADTAADEVLRKIKREVSG